jgi:hypothetical protein
MYDGDYSHIRSLGNNYYCKDPDNVIVNGDINPGKEGDNHYITPPDLFNSFQNVSDLSIRGMFKWCGSNPGYSVVSRRLSVHTIFGGRICPYMFDSISNISSLIEFFEFCKGLSTY